MPKEEESIEDRLIKELDGATEPHAAWEAAKPELQKGTAAVAAKPKYQSKVKGPELTDKVEGYATDFYAAMGQEGSGDKKGPASLMFFQILEQKPASEAMANKNSFIGKIIFIRL